MGINECDCLSSFDVAFESLGAATEKASEAQDTSISPCFQMHILILTITYGVTVSG